MKNAETADRTLDEGTSKIPMVLRRLRRELVACRRDHAVRSHHRMDVELLVETLLEEVEQIEWADDIARRLRRSLAAIRRGGLTDTVCLHLEASTTRLRRLEQSLKLTS